MKITITEQDVSNSVKVVTCFGTEIEARLFTPSEVGSPMTMALLRTLGTGFPVNTDDYKEVLMPETDEANKLRMIYVDFLADKTCPSEFHDIALPLFLEAKADALIMAGARQVKVRVEMAQ
jgi:hypothetical protein